MNAFEWVDSLDILKYDNINYYWLFQSEQGSEEFGSRRRGVQSQVLHLGLELGVAGEDRRQEGEWEPQAAAVVSPQSGVQAALCYNFHSSGVPRGSNHHQKIFRKRKSLWCISHLILNNPGYRFVLLSFLFLTSKKLKFRHWVLSQTPLLGIEIVQFCIKGEKEIKSKSIILYFDFYSWHDYL